MPLINTTWSSPVRDVAAAAASTNNSQAGSSAIRRRCPPDACSQSAAISAMLISVANWLRWRRLP
ncbi:MAG: hypothetical protein WKG52_05085 [Variovorax sp.]